MSFVASDKDSWIFLIRKKIMASPFNAEVQS